MNLPDPDTHCFDDDTQQDVWSYSKELVEQMLAQADKDFSDGMTVVHLQVADQMKRRYEPVLKMALEILEDNRHDVECVERSSYMRECYDPAIEAIKGVLG